MFFRVTGRAPGGGYPVPATHRIVYCRSIHGEIIFPGGACAIFQVCKKRERWRREEKLAVITSGR
jgi:hypothetical protein